MMMMKFAGYTQVTVPLLVAKAEEKCFRIIIISFALDPYTVKQPAMFVSHAVTYVSYLLT